MWLPGCCSCDLKPSSECRNQQSAALPRSSVLWPAYLATSDAQLGTRPDLLNFATSTVMLVPRASPHPALPPPHRAPRATCLLALFRRPGSKVFFTFSCLRQAQSRFPSADNSPDRGLPDLPALLPLLASLTWDHPSVGAAGRPHICLSPICPKHLATSSPSQACSLPPAPSLQF